MNHKLLLQAKKEQQKQKQKNNNNNSLIQIYNQIHLKLIDMISHIMKRSREDRKLKLPCLSILKLLYDESINQVYKSLDPFTLNLSLSFLTLGINRCDNNNENMIE